MSSDLVELVQRLGEPRVLVVGDVMLDRYVWGDADRISQEAPGDFFRADRREERLGGASSVATLLRALGARVALAGVVGADQDAARVRELFTELGIDHEGVVTDTSRPTTVKERYIGRAQHKHPQQILRVDYETRSAIAAEVEQAIWSVLERWLTEVDVVLLSDYDKGVCTPSLLAWIITAARSRGVRVLADPIRGRDYRKYHGCSAITPNRLEASLASGRDIPHPEAALQAAVALRDHLDLEAAIITLDKDGMVLADRTGRTDHYLTRPRQVYDITGAGDMVLAVLGLALAAGADYPEAIRLANVAGGLEVEKIGVATVSRDEIVTDLERGSSGERGETKLVTLSELQSELARRRTAGQRIAFTNGCFDVLHAGHVQYLREAKAQADVLVVGLNSDASVRALKGPARPVQPESARSLVLAGLQAVDYVVIFDELTPANVIEAVRPDVLVKGADYAKADVVGAEFVESYGGRVHLAALRDGFSTTNLIRRLTAA